MPTYPNILPPSIPVLPPRDIQVLDRSFRNPHSVQATVGVEQTLFGMIVGVDVMHLRGYDLFSLVDTNAPASVHEPASRTVAEADATRPITPVPNGFRKIIALGNEGASWYRALQIKADKSKGPVQTIVAYTWSRSEDQANYVLPEDSRNLDAEKGRADNDIRHNLSVGLTWQMPGGRRGLNGLTLSGFGVFRSNRPYTVTWGDDRNGTSQNDARPGGAQHRQRRDLPDRRSVAREAVSRRANVDRGPCRSVQRVQRDELRPVRRRAVVSVFRTAGDGVSAAADSAGSAREVLRGRWWCGGPGSRRC